MLVISDIYPYSFISVLLTTLRASSHILIPNLYNYLTSIVTPVLTNLCIPEFTIIPLQKYDKPCVHEYIRHCPLNHGRNRHFFCTRRKNFLYAYKIIFCRDANIFSSGEKFDFFVFFDFLCPVIYDKPPRKLQKGIVQNEQT